MVTYKGHDGVTYEFVGNGTMGADREKVVVLKRIDNGELEVVWDCVLDAVILDCGIVTSKACAALDEELTGKPLFERVEA